MAASTVSILTADIGSNPEILRWEIDILLLMVVAVDDRLSTEDGEEDLGVESSELELLL